MGVVFATDSQPVVGIGDRGRRWMVSRCLTGWRLEFRDVGDRTATYAGTFGTLEAAMAEAAR
jgi:hypothetical protein